MWIAEERKRHLGGWLTAFVVMLDKTLMATSFLSVSLFQWPLFPDSNCDRTNPLSAYIVQTAAGTVTASKYTIKRSCYNTVLTVSNSAILWVVNKQIPYPPTTAYYKLQSGHLYMIQTLDFFLTKYVVRKACVLLGHQVPTQKCFSPVFMVEVS